VSLGSFLEIEEKLVPVFELSKANSADLLFRKTPRKLDDSELEELGFIAKDNK
jgi:hypothetical protein